MSCEGINVKVILLKAGAGKPLVGVISQVVVLENTLLHVWSGNPVSYNFQFRITVPARQYYQDLGIVVVLPDQ